jgi:hypothetical protein
VFVAVVVILEEDPNETEGITPFGGYALTLSQRVGPRGPLELAPLKNPIGSETVGTSKEVPIGLA